MKSLETTAPAPLRRANLRRANRTAPLDIRFTSTARMLAHRGAMAPEGVSEKDLERSRNNFRLFPAQTKQVLGMLWSFRLLGWFPGDTLYLTFDQITAYVSSGTRRPSDTQDLMPHGFTVRHTAADLREYRAGKDA